jgi:hypothetical protein
MLPNNNIRIGCSGWEYRHQRDDSYPADLPQSRWFDHYARVFDTVEVNNTTGCPTRRRSSPGDAAPRRDSCSQSRRADT